MTQEEIDHELRARNISVTSLVHSYPNYSGSVYQGWYQNKAVGIKVKRWLENKECIAIERECNTWKTVSHPNLMQLYDCFWAMSSNQQVYYYVFVKEWCTRDLNQETILRAQKRFYWAESEMWSMLRSLASVLATLQSHGIVHRNIKPDNIYYTYNSQFKIGDFSTAKVVGIGTIMETIGREDCAGTLMYLSPEMKRVISGHLRQAIVNPYKSDVYSLGLTLIHVAQLAYPDIYKTGYVTDDQTSMILYGLSYYSSHFQSVLKWMLFENPDKRCDFLELSQYLATAGN